ncbi:FliM/FliN family flagellar motor switch protein [Terriglobus sp. RCC_193]|uniref:FliM/FliN family flagellar motor switch protein n=1 Tax=Terriglobus sp. RCC_193 TaxID=3239218 RepID=UPI003524772A
MNEMYGAGEPAMEQEIEQPSVESLLTGDRDAFLDIEVEARIHLGSREMLLSEVLELNPGDVLELDRLVSDPVDLLVGDRIVARGEVVIVGGNFALQVTEVAVPRLRLESVRCLH